ncbi:hypothetical protein V6Z12_A12G074800 [Gossypium hirsutum]
MDTYDFLINNVWAKLSGCDTRKLSMAGRVTFAISILLTILLTILIYFMSSTIIPISTCNEIEKLLQSILLNHDRINLDDGIWITFFCLSIWLLWKRLNTFVFQGAHSDSKELMRTALSWARLYNDTLANRKIEMMNDDSMQWTAPKDDWVKLNSDGLVDLDINIAAVGVCDVSIFQAEARSLLEGLQLAWDRGYRNVEVENDNALLIQMIRSGISEPTGLADLQKRMPDCFQA